MHWFYTIIIAARGQTGVALISQYKQLTRFDSDGFAPHPAPIVNMVLRPTVCAFQTEPKLNKITEFHFSHSKYTVQGGIFFETKRIFLLNNRSRLLRMRS